MAFGTDSTAMAEAERRAVGRLDAALADLAVPTDGRLDDLTRAALDQALRRLVDEVEADLLRGAGRLLASAGDTALADRAAALRGVAHRRRSELVADRRLMAEAIAAVRLALLADALPAIVPEGGQPSLVVRLADLPDRPVATAARALMAADGEEATFRPGRVARESLIWRVAAAIAVAGDRDPRLVEALGEAGRRLVEAADTGGVAGAARRLVAAIEPLPAEVPDLLVEALADRRPALFAAILSLSLAIAPAVAVALLTEPDDARLPVALRATGMAREGIARVMLWLAEADPARDIEAFAEALDRVAAIDRDAASAMIAPLRLPHGLRLALAAVEPR